jgi:hypothetical protein
MADTEMGVELESFESDAKSPVYRSRYDPEKLSASMGVIVTLAEVDGRLPSEMKPLQESVNTDALDALFANGRQADESTEVSFSVPSYTVTVRNAGRITVTESG